MTRLDGAAEKTELAHFAHDFTMEDFVAESFLHPRHQFVLTIGPRGIADHPLFLGQFLFEEERIFPVELRP